MNQIKRKNNFSFFCTTAIVVILLGIRSNSYCQPTKKNFSVVVMSSTPPPNFPNPIANDSIIICAGDSLSYTIIQYVDPLAYCATNKVYTETYTIDHYPLQSTTPSQSNTFSKGVSGVFLNPCNQGSTLPIIPNITTAFYIITHVSLYVSTADVSPNYYHITKVIVSPVPAAPKVINVTPSPTTAPGGTASLQVVDTDPNLDYVWYKDKSVFNQLFVGNPFNTGALTTDTNFYLVAQQKTGVGLGGKCGSSLQQVRVFVRGALFIPNVFTPNGNDPANRKFQVRGEVIDEGTMLIYNQWGALIFQTRNIANGWDGKINGQMQPSGVYTYIVTGNYVNNQKFTAKGAITLIR